MPFPPKPVDTGHTHFTDQLVDPAANEPFDAKAQNELAKALPEGQITIYQASLTLTDAQIKTLPTDGPIPLIADDDIGPGRIAVPIAAILYCNGNAGGYTNIDANAEMAVKVGTDNVMARAIEATYSAVSDFFGAGGIRSLFLALQAVTSAASSLAFMLGDLEWEGISLHVQNGSSGNFTGGNPANFMRVTVWYGIFEI